MAHGLAKFTDEEALELLLTLATPRRDCKQQARALLKALGSLRAVLEAPARRAGQDKGHRPQEHPGAQAGARRGPALSGRQAHDRGSLADPGQAAEYLRLSMGPLKQEVFRVLLLDARRRVLANEELFAGTLNQAVVYPREVAARALAAGAAAVVAAHNHPGGDPTPSREDRALTRQLYFACSGGGPGADGPSGGGAASTVYSFRQPRGIWCLLAREYDAMHLEEMGP